MIVFRLVWRSALRRRRLFVWNVLVPLLLLAPVATSQAAAPHRAVVFGVFIVFFGAFGSAIPAIRDARDGWLDEVFRAGYAPARWLLERTLAEATLDMVQISPSLLFLLWSRGEPGAAIPVFLSAVVTLWFANLIGPLVAAWVRSLAEAALVSSALSLLLLHFAGFFRPPAPGWSQTLAVWNPYAPLRTALRAAASAAPVEWIMWPASLLFVAAFTVLAARLSAVWSRRLRWPPR